MSESSSVDDEDIAVKKRSANSNVLKEINSITVLLEINAQGTLIVPQGPHFQCASGSSFPMCLRVLISKSNNSGSMLF